MYVRPDFPEAHQDRAFRHIAWVGYRLGPVTFSGRLTFAGFAADSGLGTMAFTEFAVGTMSKILVGMVFAVFGGQAWGAGNGTHVLMGGRMLDVHFDQADEMLGGLAGLFGSEDLRRTFYCGCMFPDWGFGGMTHGAAEASHWYRFQRGYFAYLKERYPWPWDEEAKRQIAFFMGVLVHGLTDIPWHFSSGGHKAFLRRAEREDGTQHADVELAVDVFAHVEKAIPIRARGALWWPYEDLVTVYARQGLTVTAGQLEEGCRKLMMQWNLGATMSAGVHDGLKAGHRWAHANWEDYYFGGAEHGAALASMWIKRAYAGFRGWRYYQNTPSYVETFPRQAKGTACTDAQVFGARLDGGAGDERILALGGDGKSKGGSVLVRFGLSDIKPGTRVRGARLWLYFARRCGGKPTGDKVIEVYRVNQPWREGVVTDGDGGAVSSVTVEADVPARRWVDWDVTSLVRSWIDHPEKNQGMLLRETAASRQHPGIMQFYSSEACRGPADGDGRGETVALRPVLVVMLEGGGQ